MAKYKSHHEVENINNAPFTTNQQLSSILTKEYFSNDNKATIFSLEPESVENWLNEMLSSD